MTPGTLVPRYRAANPHVPQFRYQFRWDNFVILGVAALIAAIALPFVLELAPATKKPAAKPAKAMASVTEKVAQPAMTLPQARMIVEDARTAMLAGNFERADELLTEIGWDISDASGATALRELVAERQARFEALRTDVLRFAEDKDWAGVRGAVKQMKLLGPLPAEVLQASNQANTTLGSAAALKAATALLDAGKLPEAQVAAHAGYEKYHTPVWGDLINRIHDEKEKVALAKAAKDNAAAAVAPTKPSGATKNSDATKHAGHTMPAAGAGAATGAAPGVGMDGGSGAVDVALGAMGVDG